MPRSRLDSLPAYRLHKQSGQGIVTLTDPTGTRKDVLLGLHGSETSRREYDRVISEWIAGGRRLQPPAPVGGDSSLTVDELLLAFWRHAETYYSEEGRELESFRMAVRELRQLYGTTPAAEFGPKKLKLVRQRMVETTWHHVRVKIGRRRQLWVGWLPEQAVKVESQQANIEGTWHPAEVLRSRKGLARTAINKRVGRIRAIFKWGVGEELLPASAYHGLLAVRALPPNAPGVRSAPKRQPAFWGDIEKIAPHLPPPVAAMLRLQFLTGMRSGETRIIRPIDIDMSDPECWRYRPGSDAGPHGKHKNAWRGQDRVVPLGPQCQELLRPWLAAVPSQTDYLFSPRRWMDQHIAQRRADRKTPMTPSQRKRRRKSQPRKTASGCYLAASYTQTVRKACLKAGVMFTPYCLRHGRKMEVEKAAGSDAARCLLGQKSIEATMHYGQLDVARATELMKKLG